MLASPNLPAQERGGAAPGARRPARRCRPRSASASSATSASTSSTASAPPRCCTSSCPTGPGKVRYGTTGWPVPGYEIELRGDDGGPVPDGEPGDLYIQGPSAAMMYWGNRAKTRDTFQGGWTKSGDKYVRNADGSYTYGGRSDDMLKVSGIYVSPFEVEATLVQHPAVLEAAVIGVVDADGLTKTKAFVVLKAGASADRGRAEGLRQGPAGALQVPAADRVRGRPAEDGHRQDPALQAARAGSEARMTVEFVEIDWGGRRVRIEHEWIGPQRSGRPLLVFLHEGLGSLLDVERLPAAAVRGRRLPRPGVFAPRLRPLDAARRRRALGRGLHAPPGARGAAGAAARAGHRRGAALAVRPQRRRLDRAAVRGALSRRGGRRGRDGAAHLRRRLSVASIERTREAFGSTDLRAAPGAPPRRPRLGLLGLEPHLAAPAFRNWYIEAEIQAIRCPLLAVQGLDDEYGTLEQIRGIRGACRPHSCWSCPTAATRRTATSPKR